jgi:UDP-N-acetylmuramate dehydrogenase
MLILPDRSLRLFNTFGVDCIARGYASFADEDTLRALLREAEPTPLILGGGSNMLLPERLERHVLHNQIRGMATLSATAGEVTVQVGAGMSWHDLVTWAVEQGLGGIENLALIPGTVGAAPMQNIGAYGVELEETFAWLEAIDTDTGVLRRFDHAECAFGYRQSVFKSELRDRYVITSVALTLKKQPRLRLDYGDIRASLAEEGVVHPGLKDVYDAVIRIRRSKLPDPSVLGNAGSFFKNPVIPRSQWAALKATWPGLPGWPQGDAGVKVPAGWLIDQAGWKGFRRGDCGVHARQALVLVNYGAASGAEILALAEEIAADIHRRYGIRLEKEVNVLL